MIERKLMKVKEFPDGSSFWRVACECGDSAHDVNLWFEPVKDTSFVELNLSMEVGFYSKHRTWVGNMLRRISTAFRILFTGYYTAAGDVVLDYDGIKAMQSALDNGLEHIKNSTTNTK